MLEAGRVFICGVLTRADSGLRFGCVKCQPFAGFLGEQLTGEKVSCGVVGHAGFFHFAKGRFELMFVRGAVVQKPLEVVQCTRILTECRSVGTPDTIVRFHNYKTVRAVKGFAFSPHVFG